MGGGPVFIVYASLNLSHNVVVPAATWLFIRGILNIIQFGIVITLCILVNRIRPYYSHKEERLIVMNLLATHPVAYFYYVVILGGIVWNVLGSGWIGAAYKYYNHAFAVCYLVCIILSWVSVILSPTFVLCGGLVYGRVKQEPPRVEHSVMSDLLKDEDAILDLNQLVNQLNGEGKIISVDDILSRQKYVKSAFDLNRSPSTQNAEAINTNPQDVIPKVVTNIQCEEGDAQSSYDGLLLDDLAREMRKQDQSESSVVIMHHDVLDDMKDAEVEDKALRDEILKQRAVLLSDEGIRIESVSQPAAVSSATNASPRLSPRASPRASSGLTGRASISNPFPSPLLPPQPSAPKEKKKKGKKVRGHRTAKENIVAVDDVIRESTTE
ncbi:hypothetical protein WA556_000645 [Blastocystis sp. ATCC 50177/Nand II]